MIKVGLGGHVTPVATVSVPRVSVKLVLNVLNAVGVTLSKNSYNKMIILVRWPL